MVQNCVFVDKYAQSRRVPPEPANLKGESKHDDGECDTSSSLLDGDTFVGGIVDEYTLVGDDEVEMDGPKLGMLLGKLECLLGDSLGCNVGTQLGNDDCTKLGRVLGGIVLGEDEDKSLGLRLGGNE